MKATLKIAIVLAITLVSVLVFAASTEPGDRYSYRGVNGNIEYLQWADWASVTKLSFNAVDTGSKETLSVTVRGESSLGGKLDLSAKAVNGIGSVTINGRKFDNEAVVLEYDSLNHIATITASGRYNFKITGIEVTQLR